MERLGGDAWDVHLSTAGVLIAQSLLDGTKKAAFGVIGMGRRVAPLSKGFVAVHEGKLPMGA